MKRLLFIYFTTIINSYLLGQTYNTCGTAFNHGNVTATTCTGTAFNIGGSNVPNAAPAFNAPCAAIANVDEAWISFVAQSTLTVFEYANSTRDAAIVIYSGTCASLTQIACDNVGPAGPNVASFATVPGTTYYARIIRESGNATATMNGSYCVYQGCENLTYTSLSDAFYTSCTPVTPRNSIIPDGACYNGDNSGKRLCIYGGCIEANKYNEFISFTATSTSHNLVYTDGTIGTVDIALLSNSGTCASPTALIEDCFDGVTASQTINLTGLTIGQTYWLMFTSSSADVGTYSACITTPPSSCTDDEDCLLETTPIALSSNTQLCINDCNTGANNIGVTLTTNCTNPTGPVAWYEFTYPITDVLADITVTGAGWNPHIQIWSDCNTYYGSGCDNGSGNIASISAFNIGSGGTFFVSVTPENGVSSGNFEICVKTYPDPSACNTTAVITPSPLPVASEYPPNTVVTFCIDIPSYDKAACNWLQGIVPSLIGSGWDLTFGTGGINPTVTPITQSHGFGNAVGQSYGTWAWRNAGTVFYNTSGCGGAFSAPPGTCPLPAGWYFTATGSANPDVSFGDGNTTPIPQSSCLIDGSVSNDVWYSFTPATTGNYCISTNHTGGTLTDTQLAIWRSVNPVSSCNGSLVLVGCNDDIGGANFRSRTTVNLTAGQTYFIQVDGYGGATGTFGISVSAVGGACDNSAGIPAAVAMNNDNLCNARVIVANSKNFGTNVGATIAGNGNCGASETPAFEWRACFQARTKAQASCTYGEDLSIAFKTYADGEIGNWTSIGCISDISMNNSATSANCALPVKLLSFTAEYLQKQNVVRLEWATLSEVNNDHFIVQRSKNGQLWEDIGTIAGHGNSNKKIDYVFFDKEPYTGTNYYRLKQVDYNGQFEIHPIVTAEVPSSIELKVFPNPANRNIKVTVIAQYQVTGNLVIVDFSGKTIFQSGIQLNDGANDVTIDISNYNNGIYTLLFYNETEVSKMRFVKE